MEVSVVLVLRALSASGMGSVCKVRRAVLWVKARIANKATIANNRGSVRRVLWDARLERETVLEVKAANNMDCVDESNGMLKIVTSSGCLYGFARQRVSSIVNKVMHANSGVCVAGMDVGVQFADRDFTTDTDYMRVSVNKGMGAASFGIDYLETDEAGGSANDTDKWVFNYVVGF